MSSYSSYYHNTFINSLIHIVTTITCYQGILMMLRGLPIVLMESPPFWLHLPLISSLLLVVTFLRLDQFTALVWGVILAGELVITEATYNMYKDRLLLVYLPLGFTLFVTQTLQIGSHQLFEHRAHPIIPIEAFVWTPFSTVFNMLHTLFNYRTSFYTSLRTTSLWEKWARLNTWRPNRSLPLIEMAPMWAIPIMFAYMYAALYNPKLILAYVN